jgi:quinol monooxygenase YgiN
MYGSIMRARIKSGRRAEFEKLMHDLVPSAGDYGQGLHSVEMAFEDADPDRVVVVVHFKDKATYVANADRPETDAEYRRMAEFFDGEPEWVDVHFGDYVGRPLTETVSATTG